MDDFEFDDRVKRTLFEQSVRIDVLKAENAKLRELLVRLYYLTMSEREALKGLPHGDETYLKALDETIENMREGMRELGIEVYG